MYTIQMYTQCKKIKITTGCYYYVANITRVYITRLLVGPFDNIMRRVACLLRVRVKKNDTLQLLVKNVHIYIYK